MKKELLILLFTLTLILNLFSIAVINADLVNVNPNTGEADVLGINPETIPQTPEDAKTVAKNYLLKEWSKEFRNENTTLGKFTSPVFKAYDKISPYTDPVFKYTIGMAPKASWLFILTLTVWITLITFFYRIFSGFSTFSKGISFMISFLIILIISNMKISIWIAKKIISAISILTSFWAQLIAVILIITLFILASMFSKEFEALIKQWKENRRKMKMEEEIEELKAQGKSTKVLEEALAEIGRSVKD